MSKRNDLADLADAPFEDDAERAESAWLLAREKDPGAPAPSAAIATEYAEIEDLLGSLPSGASDDGWHDQVLRRGEASRITPSPTLPSPPWWRRKWVTAGAFITAAAIVLLIWLYPRVPLELEIATLRVDSRGSAVAMRGDSKVVRGDRLVVTARPRGPSDLRVYRADGTLVARCPSGPRCAAADKDRQVIDITLDAPVQYHVILVVGMSDAPLRGTMDSYIDAARAANARIVIHEPIDVQ